MVLNPPCPFITALQDYLEKTPDKQENSQLAFLHDWERIAPPVPPKHKENGLSRICRFQAINELRNKLAHVPISGRILPSLHNGLRKELLLLLTYKTEWINADTTADLPIQHWHNPLCGRIVNKYAYVEGSTFGKASNNNDFTEVYWEWNPEPNPKKQKQNDWLKWKASPFVHFDDELKVSLLFRLPNLSYDLDVSLTGEYYRFAAEVEPVQKRNVSVEAIQPWIPVKVPLDVAEAIDSPYINDASTNLAEVIEEQLVPLEELKAEELRKKAEDAFKASDYPNAVMYYDEMTKRKLPNYTDVAQSRHGAALWRVANRSEADIEERKAQFRRSIQLLDEASQHREIGYKAESHYQKSKALWHLSEIDVENRERFIEQSIEEVEIALGLSLEQRYIGWYEWLREKIETFDDETDTSDDETGNSNDEADNSENQ